MTTPALLLDEDVRLVLASTLQQCGYDAEHVVTLGRAGQSDLEQLRYAVNKQRAMVTHNIRDFVVLDRQFRSNGQDHCGIVVSDQVPMRDLLRRLLRMLSQVTKEQALNSVIWLHDV